MPYPNRPGVELAARREMLLDVSWPDRKNPLLVTGDGPLDDERQRSCGLCASHVEPGYRLDLVHDDDGLFADPRPAQAQPTAPDPDPDAVPDWLIANVRKVLDELGVETMAERQALVVELAGRPLDSLRELTPVEARQVSEKLSARRRKNTSTSTRSSWDDRDGDTWIDRM